MGKGSPGTGKPYLRGKIWWIKYSVPGETKPRYESSNSISKKDAVRLLNKRRSEIDNRQVTPANVFVADLLDLYLADQRKQARHSYKQAEGYVRLHLKSAFGKLKASAITTPVINRVIEQKQNAEYANATGGLRRYADPSRWARPRCRPSFMPLPSSTCWLRTTSGRVSWNTASTSPFATNCRITSG